jgi:hypothetical protein
MVRPDRMEASVFPWLSTRPGIAAGVAVAAGICLIVLTEIRSSRWRLIGACLVLLGMLGAMMAQPFQRDPGDMGDYGEFIKDKHTFHENFDELQFQYHLGSAIVRGLNAAFGGTSHSPPKAFDTLARLASVAFVLGLLWLLYHLEFSTRVVRYCAMAVTAPVTLLLFGYHEFGYLPEVFFAVAIPLAIIGLERGRDGFVIAAAVLLGVGAALHGFGLVAAVFLLLVALAWEYPRPRVMATRLVHVVGGVVFGWLSWLALYFIVLKWTVVPGHAHELPLRPLFHTTREVDPYGRFDYAVFSGKGLHEILFEFLILGVFVSAVVIALLPRDRAWRIVTLTSLPVFLFAVLWWPVQGIGVDTDFLGAAFPSLYAIAWLASASKRVSLIAVIGLALCQVAMLIVVHGHGFQHPRDF